MNEEFAIQLKMLMDNSSIATVKKQIQEVTESAKKTMTNAVSPATNVTDTFDVEGTRRYGKQIEYLNSKVLDLKEQMRLIDAGEAEGDVLKIEAEIERILNQIASLVNRTEKVNQVVKSTTYTTITLRNNFSKVLRSARMFVGALIGARTVYAGIRKAMGSYLAQNEELQNKLNGAWYALGSLFAPVLEWIINKFVYLVSLVDALVKSLGFAGVNMSNYGKATAKAGKAQKSLAGFDEINNIDNSSGSGVGGSALNPVSDEELGKFKQILAIIGAIVGALAYLKGLFKLSDIFDLTPAQMIGITVAIAGIAFAIYSLMEYLKDPSWLNFGRIIVGIGIALTGIGVVIGSTPLIIAGVVTTIAGILASFWPQINNFFLTIQNGINNLLRWVHQNITSKFGIFGIVIGSFLETVLQVLYLAIETIRLFLDGLFKSIKDILDGIIKIFRGDFSGGIKQILNALLNLVVTILNGMLGTLKTMFTAISGLVVNLFTNIWNTVSGKMKGIINTLIIGPINRVIGWINGALNFSYDGLRLLGKQVIPSFQVNLGQLKTLPQLEVGTNFVPNDMIAQLHQGEAVIPKAFNEEQFTNSEETNNLLRELIDVVYSKEFRAYISQNEIGKTAVKYINNQSRILGGSVV